MISGQGLTPNRFLHFVELDEFRADWQVLGLNVEHDLLALQWELMASPAKGALIVGTGGLRKLRFSPPAFPQGKSGGIRVCYCYWPHHFLILLVMAYPKTRKADLNAAERAAIRRYLERTEKWLERRNDP